MIYDNNNIKLDDYKRMVFRRKLHDKISIIGKCSVVIIFAIMSFFIINMLFNDEVKAEEKITIEYNSTEFKEIFDRPSNQLLYNYMEEYLEANCNPDYTERFYMYGFSNGFDYEKSNIRTSVTGYCMAPGMDVVMTIEKISTAYPSYTYLERFGFKQLIDGEVKGLTNFQSYTVIWKAPETGETAVFEGNTYGLYEGRYYTKLFGLQASVATNYEKYKYINYYDFLNGTLGQNGAYGILAVPYKSTIDIKRAFRPDYGTSEYEPVLIIDGRTINDGDIMIRGKKSEYVKEYSFDTSEHKNIKLTFTPQDNELISLDIYSSYAPIHDKYQGEAWNVKTYCGKELIHEAETVLFASLGWTDTSSLCENGEKISYELTLYRDIPNYNPSQKVYFEFGSNVDSIIEVEYISQDIKDIIIGDNQETIDGNFLKVERTFNTYDYSNFKLIFHMYPLTSGNKITFKTLHSNILPPLKLRLFCGLNTTEPLEEKITTNYKHFNDFLLNSELTTYNGSCANEDRYLEVSFVEDLLNYRDMLDITIIYERYEESGNFNDFYYSLTFKTQKKYNMSDITDGKYNTDIQDYTEYLDKFLEDFKEVKDLVNDMYNRFFYGLPPYLQFVIDFALILLLSIVVIKVGVET